MKKVKILYYHGGIKMKLAEVSWKNITIVCLMIVVVIFILREVLIK
jgi:hypothetical protein